MIDRNLPSMLALSGHEDVAALDDDSQPDQPMASGVVIALSSPDCLSFAFQAHEMRSLSKRSLLVYELEDYVPVDGDDLAVSTLPSSRRTLVVAIDAKRFTQTLANLEERGTFVHAICPKVMLGIQTLGRTTKLKEVDWIFWQTEGLIDAVRLSAGRPVRWDWIQNEPADVWRLLSIEEGPQRVLAVNCSPESFSGESSSDSFEFIDRNLDEAANESCAKIVQGVSRPWFDLRDGPLQSRRPHQPIAIALRAALVGFLLLQALIAVTAFFKGRQYRARTADIVADQERAYQSVFPDQGVPIGMVSRLESEERRLMGTRGLSGNSAPQVGSIVPAAHKFLSALPSKGDARFQLNRIELVPGAVESIIGEANSFETVEVIGQRLRNAGFNVPPASSTKKGEGVTLRLEDIIIPDRKD